MPRAHASRMRSQETDAPGGSTISLTRKNGTSCTTLPSCLTTTLSLLRPTKEPQAARVSGTGIRNLLTRDCLNRRDIRGQSAYGGPRNKSARSALTCIFGCQGADLFAASPVREAWTGVDASKWNDGLYEFTMPIALGLTGRVRAQNFE